jgi:outer membrane protein
MKNGHSGQMKPQVVVVLPALISIGCSLHARAQEPGHWRISAGYVYVDSSIDGELHGITGSGITPTGDGSGMLSVLYQPSTRWGIELFIAPPFDHALEASGSITGLGTLITVESLPITVQAQHLFLPARSVRPFVGLGLTYARFADESASRSLRRLTGTDVDIEFGDDLALTLSAGLELALTVQWSVELAAAYSELDPGIRLSGRAFDTSPLRTIAYTTQIGYRF